MINIIIELFNVEQNAIKSITTYRKGTVFYVEVTLMATQMICTCGMEMRIKEYYKKQITHNLLQSDKTVLLYRARRFQCPQCKRTCYEFNPFAATHHKLTHSLRSEVIKTLMQPNQTFQSVANQFHISSTTVVRVFDELVNDTRKNFPKILCLDGLYFSRHASHKYCCVLVDFESHQIVDIYESRKKYDLVRELERVPQTERDEVEMVCTDMYEHYRPIIKRFFKKATHAVGLFHLMKLVNDQLNRFRVRVMNTFLKNSNEYYVLKTFHYLLFQNGPFDINDTPQFNRKLNGYYNKARLLRALLAVNPTLADFYYLKGQIRRDFHLQQGNRNDHAKKLHLMIERLKQLQIEEATLVALAFENWEDEILNSFTWINQRRISNGPVESVNAQLKKLKVNANGFFNFKQFRARCFLVVNQEYLLKASSRKNHIKLKGNPRGPYKKK